MITLEEYEALDAKVMFHVQNDSLENRQKSTGVTNGR